MGSGSWVVGRGSWVEVVVNVLPCSDMIHKSHPLRIVRAHLQGRYPQC